jgi:hypothetical protein
MSVSFTGGYQAAGGPAAGVPVAKMDVESSG